MKIHIQQLIKNLLIILIISSPILNCHAQVTTDNDYVIYIPKYQELTPEQKESGKFYINVDSNPWHEQGTIQSFIDKSKKFPQKALSENVQGNTVRLSFVVDRTGRVKDIRVITSASPSLDAEAIRAVRSIPRQSPATKDDITVPVEYYYNVSFEEEIDRPLNILETTGFWLPKYKGGIPALLKYLGQSLKYPRVAAENGVQGTVVVRFVVSPKGEVTDLEILSKVSPECDAEAIRVIKSMKDWLPAVSNGEYVSCYFTLPIRFAFST